MGGNEYLIQQMIDRLIDTGFRYRDTGFRYRGTGIQASGTGNHSHGEQRVPQTADD